MACSHQPDIDRYVSVAEDFIRNCERRDVVQGFHKLQKKCLAELRFLRQLKKKDRKSQESHLKSTNLNHYAGVLYTAEMLPGVEGIFQSFSLPSRDSLVVDVVACQGLAWVKVIARKAQALHLIWAGQGQFGDRSITCQAKDYLKSAAAHPVNYAVPVVVFIFYNEITQPIVEALTKLGVKVWGETVPISQDVKGKLQCLNDVCENYITDPDDELLDKNPGSALRMIQSETTTNLLEKYSSSFDLLLTKCHQISKADNPLSEKLCFPFLVQEFLNERKPSIVENQEISDLLLPASFTSALCVLPGCCSNILDIRRVNLDITTLITLVSAICHGRSHFIFVENILTMQAKEEQSCPVLPKLQEFMQGKQLFACETAIKDFKNILHTLGGKLECEQAEKLLSQICIIPDHPSERAKNLPTSGKIKERSKIIFGTGDWLKAVTMTANLGFIRAARNQGLLFAVFIHSSRALTEEKEQFAKPLTDGVTYDFGNSQHA